MSYERSYDEEIKAVSSNNKNNNYYHDAVNDVKSDDEDEESIFEDQIENEIEVTPKTTLNPNEIRAMKILQALYNEDANKFLAKAEKEKATKGNLFF